MCNNRKIPVHFSFGCKMPWEKKTDRTGKASVRHFSPSGKSQWNSSLFQMERGGDLRGLKLLNNKEAPNIEISMLNIILWERRWWGKKHEKHDKSWESFSLGVNYKADTHHNLFSLIFSYVTGMAISDINNLQWESIGVFEQKRRLSGVTGEWRKMNYYLWRWWNFFKRTINGIQTKILLSTDYIFPIFHTLQGPLG